MCELTTRLERLERNNSRLWIAASFSTATLVLLCTLGAVNNNNANVITARSFQIVNAKGQVVGEFAAGPPEGTVSSLVLKDTQGQSVMGMYSMSFDDKSAGSLMVHNRGEQMKTHVDGGQIRVWGQKTDVFQVINENGDAVFSEP